MTCLRRQSEKKLVNEKLFELVNGLLKVIPIDTFEPLNTPFPQECMYLGCLLIQ